MDEKLTFDGSVALLETQPASGSVFSGSGATDKAPSRGGAGEAAVETRRRFPRGGLSTGDSAPVMVSLLGTSAAGPHVTGGPTSRDYLLMLGLLIPHTHTQKTNMLSPPVYYCDQTDAPGHRNIAADTHTHTLHASR